MITNKEELIKAKKNLLTYDNFIKSEIDKLDGKNKVEIELVTNALNAQKEKLKLNILEYEELIKKDKIIISNIYDLPKTIVKARLKSGYSINDLAKKIEITEKELYILENQSYRTASLERIIQILNVLNIDFSMILKF